MGMLLKFESPGRVEELVESASILQLQYLDKTKQSKMQSVNKTNKRTEKEEAKINLFRSLNRKQLIALQKIESAIHILTKENLILNSNNVEKIITNLKEVILEP